MNSAATSAPSTAAVVDVVVRAAIVRFTMSKERDVRVLVDLNACDLHGLCVEAAPEVFEIGNDGVLHVLLETPEQGLRAKVDKAVRECPTGAISVTE